MTRWPRRLLIAAVLVVLVVTFGASTVYISTERKLKEVHDLPMALIEIPTDSASLERGRHLATAVSVCVDCHGPDLGGKVFIEDPAIGLLVASNLTQGAGGVGDRYTDQELARAIRHGIRADGTPLLFMPSQVYNNLSDADLGALVAYIRSLPPVDRTFPPSKVGPVARALYLAGKFPLLPVELIDHQRRAPQVVEAARSAEYGGYLVALGGCYDCHGPRLTGGPIPGMPRGTPPATDITPAGAMAGWTEAEFIHAMRTGQRPDGTMISPVMPWPYLGQMTDDELGAIWLFLMTLEVAGK